MIDKDFEEGGSREFIPLMFKCYPKGRMSETLVKGPVDKLLISEPKG